MNVLLSLEKEYADAIFSGIKKYEFRRVIFKNQDVKKVYIYCNASVKRIVGSFEIEKILTGTPDEMWKICHKHSGISKEGFFRYFKGAKRAYAIKVKNIHKLKRRINPYSAKNKFTPPQSFYYLPNLKQFTIKRR